MRKRVTLRSRVRYSSFWCRVSVKSNEGWITPLPRHDGQASEVGMSSAGRTLWRAELAEGENVVTCAVIGHYLAHVVIELLPVLRLVHIYEVYDYDASHIAQSELTGYLVGGADIDFKSIGLLVLGGFGAVA